MATLLTPTPIFSLQNTLNCANGRNRSMSGTVSKSSFTNGSSTYRNCLLTKATAVDKEASASSSNKEKDYGVVGMHHVGILCENLERSMQFYQDTLGLSINEGRPHEKLPYRGAWLWVGSEMIHLMELPNPDPLTGRPDHGGRDRHTCVRIKSVLKLKSRLDEAGIPYTLSRSGRPAIFFRDPDANALEFAEFDG